MSQVTQVLIDEFRRSLARGEFPPHTINEAEQLLWAWEELQRMRASSRPMAACKQPEALSPDAKK